MYFNNWDNLAWTNISDKVIHNFKKLKFVFRTIINLAFILVLKLTFILNETYLFLYYLFIYLYHCLSISYTWDYIFLVTKMFNKDDESMLFWKKTVYVKNGILHLHWKQISRAQDGSKCKRKLIYK